MERVLFVALALPLPLSMGYSWLAYRRFPPIIWPLPSADPVGRGEQWDFGNRDHALEGTRCALSIIELSLVVDLLSLGHRGRRR